MSAPLGNPVKGLAALLVLGLLLAPATSDEPPRAPPFEVTTAAGATHTGFLETLAADWSIQLLDGVQTVRVRGADVVTLRREGQPLPPHPTGPQVVFANGDRVPLPAQPELLLARARLHFRPASPLGPGKVELDPPLRTVALIWLAAPHDSADASLALRRLLAESRRHDVVLLRDGDRVQGTLAELGSGRCRVLAGRRQVDLALSRVAVIALNSELRMGNLPAGPYGHLVLSDGCRLALASARVDTARRALVGKTLFGATVETPLDRVVTLDLRQGAAVYLSDLEPKTYVHTPFLGASWPYVRDGTVAGRELRLRGATYDKGVGMHSESRLTYDLGGRYRRFEAVVGLDERTGKRGRVRVEVLVDGKARDLGRTGDLSAADAPLRLRLDVRGARALTLVVRFGRFGDVQGHVNWGDARLIR